MQQPKSIPQNIYLAVMALLGWFALVTQFYININSGLASKSEIIVRYFSFFTLDTNLIVAVCSSSLLLSPTSKWGQFFSKQKTLTAITVYILIVGIIYNVILRFLWQPAGFQKLVDEILHSVIPVLFLIFWSAFVTKNHIKWQAILPWLIYPLVYLFFVLARGSFAGFFPYPFLNITTLGVVEVFINSVGIAIAFVVVALVFVGVGNALLRRV